MVRNMFKWEKDVKLVTSRFFIYDVIRVSVLSYILINFMLLITSLLVDGGKDYTPDLFIGSALAVAAVALAILLVAMVFFGNKMPFRFAVTDTAASMEMISRKAKKVNRLSFFLGLAAGKPAVAGAGAIATSREYTELEWKHCHNAKYYPKAKAITLLNSWRAVIRLYCTDENYQEVADFVSKKLASVRESRLTKEPSEKVDFTKIALNLAKFALVTATAWICLLSPFPIPEWIIVTSWIAGILMIVLNPPPAIASTITIIGFLATLALKVLAGMQISNVFEDFQYNPNYRPSYANYSGFDNFDFGDWGLFITMSVLIATVVFMSIGYLRAGRHLPKE